MSYTGGVPVNSGFYPRNDFPIVNAEDVYVSDDQRLNEALEEISGNIPGEMTGATSSAAGKSGLVPAPAAGEQSKYLTGAGAWSEISKSTIGLDKVENKSASDILGELTSSHSAITGASVNYATSAGTANAVAWGNVTGKPTAFPPETHDHTITASASDDDVVVLTGTNGTNKVTYSASHATSGVTAGTYKSVTVNKYGHVTAGTNPTTLSGYGITDAYTKVEITSTVELITVDDIDAICGATAT